MVMWIDDGHGRIDRLLVPEREPVFVDGEKNFFLHFGFTDFHIHWSLPRVCCFRCRRFRRQWHHGRRFARNGRATTKSIAGFTAPELRRGCARYEEIARSKLSSSGSTMPTSADPQARQLKL